MAVLRGSAVDHPAGGSDAGGGRWAALAGLSFPVGGAGGWCCCCEVWQGWQAVGAVQVGQGWRWCVVIVGGGLLLAWSSGAALAVLILPGAGGRRCGLLRLRGAGVVIVAAAATPSACRAADPAGRAGGKAAQKKKARAAARCALLLWPSVCGGGGAICCAGCIPVHIVGGGGSAPRSGAGPLALALIRAQRFRLATFQHGTACAGGAPSGAFLPFAGGVRFSTLPGSALGVGLRLSRL